MVTHVLPLGTFSDWTAPVKVKRVVVGDELHAWVVFPPPLLFPVPPLPEPDGLVGLGPLPPDPLPHAARHPIIDKASARAAMDPVFNFPPNCLNDDSAPAAAPGLPTNNDLTFYTRPWFPRKKGPPSAGPCLHSSV
jgi:hypothetical protein